MDDKVEAASEIAPEGKLRWQRPVTTVLEIDEHTLAVCNWGPDGLSSTS